MPNYEKKVVCKSCQDSGPRREGGNRRLERKTHLLDVLGELPTLLFDLLVLAPDLLRMDRRHHALVSLAVERIRRRRRHSRRRGYDGEAYRPTPPRQDEQHRKPDQERGRQVEEPGDEVRRRKDAGSETFVGVPRDETAELAREADAADAGGRVAAFEVGPYQVGIVRDGRQAGASEVRLARSEFAGRREGVGDLLEKEEGQVVSGRTTEGRGENGSERKFTLPCQTDEAYSRDDRPRCPTPLFHRHRGPTRPS